MIYGLALLLLLLALVLLVPALRRINFMRRIRREGTVVQGTITSSGSALGWLWTASFGNQQRTLVSYTSPKGTELVVELVAAGIIPQRGPEAGQNVQVMYAASDPGRAFVLSEWETARRDVWWGVGAILAAILLWIIGRVFNLPF